MRPHTKFLINLFKKESFFPKTFVEIGVFKGDNAFGLLSNTTIEAFLGVDPYVRYPDFINNLSVKNGTVAKADLTKVKKEMLKRMEPFGSMFQLLEVHSTHAATMIDDGLLDCVFIDGNHYYDYVVMDIKAWLPKVVSGGIIAGHDYTKKVNCGVIQAVNELLPDHEFNRNSKVWWYRKP